jgi:hypothetical protein
MTISRMQQPRQMYGLGSFVKKAVKGVTGAVKKIARSKLGKAALIGAGMYGLGGGFGAGFQFGNIPGFTAAKNFMVGTGLPIGPRGPASGGIFGAAKTFLGGEPTLGKTLGIGVGGSLLGTLFAKAQEGDEEAIGATRNVEALRSYLSNGFKDLGYSDEEIPALVEQNVSEYTSGQGGYANGGRIGYAYGSNDLVEQASGIMGLPQRVNQAGVKELDLRDSGGFIPPVGVKEKADDIPAMLSNNEFVFTAESVRNMGNGDVNKGAQRMYDMMKYLEKGGRV